MSPTFPVIDLFAGPGGLGEGFCAFSPRRGQPGFDVRLSVEMNPVAHRTLVLRKFFRSFAEAPPEDYFTYLAGRLSREELFARHPSAAEAAQQRAWQIELGRKDNAQVTARITRELNGASVWALIGGPPCQAYSLVGRSRMQSRTNPEFEKDHRHFLYREYLRIVARHQPTVFLMENVKGLISATHGGEPIFRRILGDLQYPGRALGMRDRAGLAYNLHSVVEPNASLLRDTRSLIEDPQCLVVHAERFGIPQARHRVFVLGIRSDFRVAPDFLQPSDAPSVDAAIGDLPAIRSTLSREDDSIERWRAAVAEVRSHSWFRDPGTADLRSTVRTARQSLANLEKLSLATGGLWLQHTGRPAALGNWYRAGARGVSNHEARGHMRSDLQRYFFAACFAEASGERSPTLEDFPQELLPNHRNAARGQRGEMFADRFRVQLRDRYATTVTSHISKDGHYFIHPDPEQCRSLTVREAARLQTFPDSYHFEGPRTEQYHQVGNAVPPLLAKQIAAIVYKVLQNSTGR